MEASKKLHLAFYQHVGKIFYAIASADNTINEAEYNTLKSIVKSDWLLLDSCIDKADNNTSPIIDVFNWLDKEQDYDSEICYMSFIDFKTKNEVLFTDEIKQLIIKTAGAIAASFSGINKSELIMLAKLNIELKK